MSSLDYEIFVKACSKIQDKVSEWKHKQDQLGSLFSVYTLVDTEDPKIEKDLKKAIKSDTQRIVDAIMQSDEKSIDTVKINSVLGSVTVFASLQDKAQKLCDTFSRTILSTMITKAKIKLQQINATPTWNFEELRKIENKVYEEIKKDIFSRIKNIIKEEEKRNDI